MGVTVRLQDSHVIWDMIRAPGSDVVVWARGYAWIDGRYFEKGQLAREVASRCSLPSPRDQIQTFRALAPKLNGSWALLVSASDGAVVVAVDRSRSVPLFYALTDAGWVVAASTDEIAGQIRNLEIEPTSAAEYILSGYVSGYDTLFKGIYQIQAAECVELSQSDGRPSSKREFYFKYFCDQVDGASEESLEKKLEQVIEHVFARYAEILKGRQLVLPLSAGYDSRLIGWMLYKNGIKNVICYTYGSAGSRHSEIARSVAEGLGYDWRFIEYNPALWADCFSSPAMEGYMSYSCRGASSPHVQDYPAVREIVGVERLTSRPIFLPGHVGDAWASEFVVSRLNKRALHAPCEYHAPYRLIADSPVVSAIVYRHLNLWPTSAKLWEESPFSDVAQKVHKAIAEYGCARGDRFRLVEWVLRSRTAVWIVNSCRCFEYFGGEFKLPMADHAIIDFFRTLPEGLLLDRNLYARVARRMLTSEGCLLRNIPVASGGTRPPWPKRWLVERLVDIGLYRPLDRLRRTGRRQQGLHAESWFTRGRRPERVKIGEILASRGRLESMPDTLRAIVSPFLNKPAYSIQCNGLLTAIRLMDLYAERGSTVGQGTAKCLIAHEK